MHTFQGIEVPPIYNPPLSSEVIDCAQRVAADFLTYSDNIADREDWPQLYRLVRTAMQRRALADSDNPTLDDESISEGIVRAINAHKGT
jgi:hypothetical protein